MNTACKMTYSCSPRHVLACQLRTPLHAQQESATEALAAAAAEDEDLWQDIARGAWPFQALCEQLCLDVVHPCWEARHGATVALREVLRSHAPSAAVSAPLAPDQPSGCVRSLLEAQHLCNYVYAHMSECKGNQAVNRRLLAAMHALNLRCCCHPCTRNCRALMSCHQENVVMMKRCSNRGHVLQGGRRRAAAGISAWRRCRQRLRPRPRGRMLPGWGIASRACCAC